MNAPELYDFIQNPYFNHNINILTNYYDLLI